MATMLLLSAVTHLWAGGLYQTLAEHQLVPAPHRRWVAALVPLTLGLTGCAVVAGMFVQFLGTGSLVCSSLLFLVLSLYARAAARRVESNHVECGCGLLGGPLTRRSFLRPAALAGVATLAAAFPSPVLTFPQDLPWVGMASVTWTSLFSLVEARMAATRWMRYLRTVHGLRVEV